MKLLFIDPKCPRPYDPEVLSTQGLGGTEATVVRVAGALSSEHEVVVLQHNRKTVWQIAQNLSFKPFAAIEQDISRADHIVFVQKAQNLSRLAWLGRGRLWLWLHNYVQDEVPLFWQDHLRYRLGIICVSRTHAKHTEHYIRTQWHSWLTASWALRGGLLYHHNPLAEGLKPDLSQARDPHKLVFFSSPYKGIEQVLALFSDAHRANPQLRLYVADPGYIQNFDATLLDHPGVVRLGSLPQSEVLRHVREALCVFYPQHKRPETFGLVYAEANAVGTPVLAHDFGAAREVLCASNPPLNARDPAAVLATLQQWVAGGAPKVTSDRRFAIDHVASGWESFFTSPGDYVRALALEQS